MPEERKDLYFVALDIDRCVEIGGERDDWENEGVYGCIPDEGFDSYDDAMHAAGLAASAYGILSEIRRKFECVQKDDGDMDGKPDMYCWDRTDVADELFRLMDEAGWIERTSDVKGA